MYAIVRQYWHNIIVWNITARNDGLHFYQDAWILEQSLKANMQIISCVLLVNSYRQRLKIRI
jgi:hypothetical protein